MLPPTKRERMKSMREHFMAIEKTTSTFIQEHQTIEDSLKSQLLNIKTISIELEDSIILQSKELEKSSKMLKEFSESVGI